MTPAFSAFVPDISEQERSLCGVLNSTHRQQNGVRHLQGITWNSGTEGYAEVTIFALKFDAVFILTLVTAARQTQGKRT